jgi:hypothetical protein
MTPKQHATVAIPENARRGLGSDELVFFPLGVARVLPDVTEIHSRTWWMVSSETDDVARVLGLGKMHLVISEAVR